MWSQKVVQQTPALLNPPLFFQATDHMQSNFTTVTWSILIAPPSVPQSRAADAAFIKLSCLSIRARFVRLSFCVLWGDISASGKWRTQRSPRPVLQTWLKCCSSSNRSFLDLKHELYKMSFLVSLSPGQQELPKLDAERPVAFFDWPCKRKVGCLHVFVGIIWRKNDLESCGYG